MALFVCTVVACIERAVCGRVKASAWLFPSVVIMLKYEKAFWASHPRVVLAGVDEAGRGCWAGPVVAAAVTMTADSAARLYGGMLAGLTDSKQLSPARRLGFFNQIQQDSEISWATGWCTAQEVDRWNILVATHLAMRRAVEGLAIQAGHVLVDGLPVKGLPCASTAIVRGDAQSFLIAAASVVAKVTRDQFMAQLDKRYPQYGFAAHKGYGVAAHRRALETCGACPEHRRSFRPVYMVEQKLPGLVFAAES